MRELTGVDEFGHNGDRIITWEEFKDEVNKMPFEATDEDYLNWNEANDHSNEGETENQDCGHNMSDLAEEQEHLAYCEYKELPGMWDVSDLIGGETDNE